MTVTTATDGSAWAASTLSMNVHMGWSNTPYANTTNVFNALHYLGISNVRDDDMNLSIMKQVAAAGFKADIITGGNTSDISTIHSLAQAFPGSIRAIEGPNEVNGNESWADSWQQTLYTSVKGDALLSSIPVFNTTESGVAGGALGNLASYTNYGNVHDYYGTGYPWLATDSNYTWMKYYASGQAAAAGEPVVVTETGVSTATVSETHQAATVLDSIMDAVRSNESFVNIYELVNSSNNGASDYESNFGLYNWDWSAKPAAAALHNFTSIIEADTGVTPGAGLDYSIAGGPSGAVSVAGGDHLFADHAGHYDLVVWSEGVSYNEKITFASGETGRVYDPMQGSSPIATFTNQTSVNVTVTDHPLIIQIDNTSSSSGAATTTVTGSATAGGSTTASGAASSSTTGSTTSTGTATSTATAPAAPTSLALTTSSDTGVSSSDHITKVATPTVTGIGEAGAKVTLYDGSTSVGSATVDSTGHWSLTTSTLSDGVHSLTAKQVDANGASVGSSALSVTIDTQAPVAPTGAHLTTTDPTVTTPTVAGAAEAGATVTLFDGATAVGHATANASGAWSITSSALGVGAHTFTEVATDIAGNQSAASTVLPWTVSAASTGSATGATISGTGTTAAATGAPTASVVQHDVWHYEGNGSTWFNVFTDYSFDVTRTGDLSKASSADWTVGKTPGSTGNLVSGDFNDTGVMPHGTVTFAAGQATATIHVAVNADNNVEQDESFSLNFSNYNNLTAGNMTATGHILNDDGPGPYTALPTTTTAATTSAPTTTNVGSAQAVAVNPLDGSAGSMTITGTAGADTIIGGNHDVLTGGAGADHFVFKAGFGTATITDFNSTSGDIIDFYGETAPTSITHVTNGVELNFGSGDHVILQGVTMSQAWSGAGWILH